MKFSYIPRYFRQIRHVGLIREWYGVQAERRTWSDEHYPTPPNMGVPEITLFSGSWDDIGISYRKFDRYSPIRKTTIERKKKLKRLLKRREARRYRARQKATGRF